MRLTGTLTETNYKTWIKTWIKALRLPFLSVGLIPLVLGITLAWNHGYGIFWPLVFFASFAVFCIMLATHLLGEYFDFETDSLNLEYNRFSGGGRAFLHREEPPKSLLVVALAAIILAVVAGVLLHFYFRTGNFTIPLGMIGICCGIFYSGKPVQWAYQGIGEVMVSFCYGWLTVNTGYYLIAGEFHPSATLISIPVALSIFNVILINEFPDYNADEAAGKKTLVVRFGKAKMARLYNIVAVITILVLPCILLFLKSSMIAVYFSLPLIVLGSGNIIVLSMKLYHNKSILENICGTSILFNLLISVCFVISLLTT